MKIKFLKASKGDCFLISFQDANKASRNILIDGGMNDTYFETSRNCDGELKLEIERIKGEKQKIDLLILTHIDDDHIWGLLKWFEMDKEAYTLIENVWFNSGRLIAEHLKEPENPDLNLGLKIFNTAETGVTKAIDFEKYLLDHDIWKRKIVKKGFELDELGVKFEVLSPNDEQLRMLLKKFNKDTRNPAYTGGSSKDWNLSFKALNSLIGLTLLQHSLPNLIQLIQYIGASYLIYIGYRTFTQTPILLDENSNRMTRWHAIKYGFFTNSLNPKTTLFVMSIYSQLLIISSNSLHKLIAYGFFISSSHLAWFCLVAIFCSTPIIRNKILTQQVRINRMIGCILIILGFSLFLTQL